MSSWLNSNYDCYELTRCHDLPPVHISLDLKERINKCIYIIHYEDIHGSGITRDYIVKLNRICSELN